MLSLGLSLSCLSYAAANMSSDSFGPSTSPFFWVFTYLAFASRNLLQSPPLVLNRHQWQAAVLAKLRRFPDLLPPESYDDDDEYDPEEIVAKTRSDIWLVLLIAILLLAIAVLLFG